MAVTKKASESAAVAAPSSVLAVPPVAAPEALLPKVAPAKLPLRKTVSKDAVAKKVAEKKVVVKKAPLKKTVAKPAAPQAAAPASPEKSPVPQKAKKPKLVRDSFTIPKAEYAVLDELKQRAALLARPTKKSELLRAGIKLLATLSDAALLAALTEVPTIKTGRPVLEK